jgi:hypothetical protein
LLPHRLGHAPAPRIPSGSDRDGAQWFLRVTKGVTRERRAGRHECRGYRSHSGVAGTALLALALPTFLAYDNRAPGTIPAPAEFRIPIE